MLLLGATPAVAQPASVTATVVTRDLNLSTSAGRAMLDHRLAQAAVDLCGSAASWDVRGKNEVRKCRAAVMAQLRTARDQRIAAASGPPTAVAAR
jgi:UrcA family protein